MATPFFGSQDGKFRPKTKKQKQKPLVQSSQYVPFKGLELSQAN
jgi:hypothetical protein